MELMSQTTIHVSNGFYMVKPLFSHSVHINSKQTHTNFNVTKSIQTISQIRTLLLPQTISTNISVNDIQYIELLSKSSIYSKFGGYFTAFVVTTPSYSIQDYSYIDVKNKYTSKVSVLPCTISVNTNYTNNTSTKTVMKVNTYTVNPIVGKIVTIDVHKINTLPNIENSTIIFVRNRVPDYMSQLSDCINVNGEIPELEVPVKVGEWQRILKIPDSSPDTIQKIYNKPFGISFNNKEIYGRITILNKITMKVYLSNGKMFKLTLVPYMSEFVNWIISLKIH